MNATARDHMPEEYLVLDYWQRIDYAHGEHELRHMLQAAGLGVRAAYTPEEVCRLLHVSERTFKRLIAAWTPVYMPNRDPAGLESKRLADNQRRVTYPALCVWLASNAEYQRAAADDDDDA